MGRVVEKRGLRTDKPQTENEKPPPQSEKTGIGIGDERGRPRLERSHSIPPKRIGEVAGGAAAECAAVCCCCPCTLMNIVVMAIYKVPACLCRKAKKRRQRLRRKNCTH
ncbi:hypothetical protein LINPERHAP1_LOCUS11523 [Linum perenne]